MISTKAVLWDLLQRGVISDLMAFFFLARWLCRNDLYFLGTKILNYGTRRVDPLFQRWFCDVLSEEKSKLILLPRDHTKSTWGIAIKVVQDVIKNPSWSILVASKTSSLSCHRLSVIKRHLSDSPLPILFPEIICKNPEREAMSKSSRYKDILWKNNEIQVLRDSQQMECTIDTAGIGQVRTGWHYNRMYLDDLIDDDTVLSDTESENALRFEKLLIPMLIDEPKGIIRQYGTKWGAGDLYDWVKGRISGEDSDEAPIKWDLIHREVVEDFETFYSYTPITKEEFEQRLSKDYSREVERAFIYSYFDDGKLQEKRSHADSDFYFYANYFNKIVGEDALVFPPPYNEVDEFPEDLEYYLTVDPAFKISRYSDYTAVVVCGYNRGPNIWIAEAIRMKGAPDELLDVLYRMYGYYGLKSIGMEDGAWQSMYQWILEHARKQEGRERLPIRGLKMGNVMEAKDKRIRALSYFFKNGAVKLKRGMVDLKRELARYPGNTRSKDDLLDALSMQREMVSWRRDEEKEAKIYERPRETYRKAFNLGRRKQIDYVRY